MDKMIYGLGSGQVANALNSNAQNTFGGERNSLNAGRDSFAEKQQANAHCAPAPVATVCELLNLAHEQFSQLQNVVNFLEDRLQMVLVVGNQAGEQSAQGVGTSEPQAVEMLRVLIERIVATTRRLDDITQRVRV